LQRNQWFRRTIQFWLDVLLWRGGLRCKGRQKYEIFISERFCAKAAIIQTLRLSVVHTTGIFSGLIITPVSSCVLLPNPRNLYSLATDLSRYHEGQTIDFRKVSHLPQPQPQPQRAVPLPGLWISKKGETTGRIP
jgi:hypothetical protein